MESKEAGVKRPVDEQRGQELEEGRAEEGETGEKREEGSADGARERREQGSTGGCLWEAAKTPEGFCDRYIRDAETSRLGSSEQPVVPQGNEMPPKPEFNTSLPP